MRKRILAFVLAGILVFGLTSCGDSGNSGKSSDSEEKKAAAEDNSQEKESSDSEKEENENEENGSGESADDHPVYWLYQQKWGEPTGGFEGGLFNESVTLPVDITALDEVAAPYRMFSAGIKEIIDNIDTDRISEILELEYNIVAEGEVIISPLIGSATKYDVDTMREMNTELGIYEIYICNLTDDALPINTCYENGWWKIEAYNGKALGIEYDEAVKVNGVTYEESLLNAIAEKFGTPTYIGGSGNEEDFYTNLAENEGQLYYYLIYEYSDYTLVIAVDEYIIGEYDGTVYNTHSAEVDNIFYYTAECWEKTKETGIDYNLFSVNSAF